MKDVAERIAEWITNRIDPVVVPDVLKERFDRCVAIVREEIFRGKVPKVMVGQLWQVGGKSVLIVQRGHGDKLLLVTDPRKGLPRLIYEDHPNFYTHEQLQNIFSEQRWEFLGMFKDIVLTDILLGRKPFNKNVTELYKNEILNHD